MRPNYRSRYVAKEIKRGPRSPLVVDFFGAMPRSQGEGVCQVQQQFCFWRAGRQDWFAPAVWLAFLCQVQR
eukprot:2109680-Lingulodinium_polyedra.AAC.1